MKTSERNDVLQSTKNWYWGGGVVPPAASPNFTKFCGGSMALAWEVADTRCRNAMKDGHVSYELVTSPTAYCDVEDAAIRLPLWYLNSKDVAELLGTEENDDTRFFSLVLVNGSTVHEALHLVHSSPPKHVIKNVKMQMTKRYSKVPNSRVVGFVYNIVEDLYIESFGQKRYAIDNAIANKNNLLFPKEHFAKAKVTFEADRTIENFFNLVPFFKKSSLQNDKIWQTLPKDIFETLKAASALKDLVRGKLPIDQREEWVIKILLALDTFESSDGGGVTSYDASDGLPGDAGAEMSVEFEKALKKLFKTARKMEREIGKRDCAGKDADKKKLDFKDGSDKALTKITNVEYGTGSVIPKIEKYDSIDAYPKASKNTDVVSLPKRKDWSFMRMLKSMRTTNRVPGEPRTRGNAIVASRLYRIATDSKIMAYNDMTVKRPQGEVEVIVLIDASGSMGGGSLPLFARVTAAARDIFMSLRNANISTVVYGHTSVNGGSVPSLVKAASYRMNGRDTSDAMVAFKKFTRIMLWENFDGYAIAEAAKSFSKRDSRIVFISLSDGSPCGRNYNGSRANEHTQKEVKKLRDSGVLLFCMSLTSYVIRPNDRIYGKQFNIDATRNVAKQFEAIIKAVAA